SPAAQDVVAAAAVERVVAETALEDVPAAAARQLVVTGPTVGDRADAGAVGEGVVTSPAVEDDGLHLGGSEAAVLAVEGDVDLGGVLAVLGHGDGVVAPGALEDERGAVRGHRAGAGQETVLQALQLQPGLWLPGAAVLGLAEETTQTTKHGGLLEEGRTTCGW